MFAKTTGEWSYSKTALLWALVLILGGIVGLVVLELVEILPQMKAVSETNDVIAYPYAEETMKITEDYLDGKIDSRQAAESVRETLISCGVIDENGDLKTVDLDKIDPIYRNGKVNSTDKDIAKACRSLMIALEWRASGRGTVSGIELDYNVLKEMMK